MPREEVPIQPLPAEHILPARAATRFFDLLRHVFESAVAQLLVGYRSMVIRYEAIIPFAAKLTLASPPR